MYRDLSTNVNFLVSNGHQNSRLYSIFVNEKIIWNISTKPSLCQLHILLDSSTYFGLLNLMCKSKVIWKCKRKNVMRYRWKILRSTNPGTLKTGNCFELPSDWLLSYCESQWEGSSKQLFNIEPGFGVPGFVLLKFCYL